MLWGMLWFIFAIGSNAYTSGLSASSEKYSLATRISVLSLVVVFLVVGLLVILFFYKIWVFPTTESVTGQPAKMSDLVPAQTTSIHVHAPNSTENITSANAANMSPFAVADVELSGPQSGFTARRPTVEINHDAIVIPLAQGPDTHDVDSVTSPLIVHVEPPRRSRSRDSTIYIPTPRRSDSVASTPNPNNNTDEAPLGYRIYPNNPSRGFFVDIDIGQLIPSTPNTAPEFHILNHGSRVTFLASTGQTALLLTTQNKAIWDFLLDDDSRYNSLLEDIQSKCEQYGEIDRASTNVPRSSSSQTRPEAVGQAYIKFSLPAAASRALRGFLDQPLEHCPVWARLLTEAEEAAWRSSERGTPPSLLTVAEEQTEYVDAVSADSVEAVNMALTASMAGEPGA
ncbi:hypothetical protein RhiJN_22700 [Ceratobasidium sp. AG-Ba]|nr:hypothetical protein RhiJN_22700 [Ceratobasidium sp. AG-Ba]